ISLFDSNALVSPPPTTVVCALSLHDALPISAHAEADVQIGGGEVAQSLPGGGAALAFLGRPLLEAAGLELLGQDLVQVAGREVLTLVDQSVELHACCSCRIASVTGCAGRRVPRGRRGRAGVVMSSAPGRRGRAPSGRPWCAAGPRPAPGSRRPARARCARR